MSEQLRFIIQELNKEPFKKSFNLISFDSLDSLVLLQTLNDVIAEIDSSHRIDLREESADVTAIRLLEALRIFRYKPTLSPDGLNEFRQALIQGDKSVIYPSLAWLLQRIPELKKRAYLAKFLVKIQVPNEFMIDEEVKQLYQQYEEYMNSFKDTHKELEGLRNGGVTTADIKKDISAMQDEKEQLIRRVERLKKRVESFPKSGPMLEVAKKLRIERDRETKLHKQVQEQRNMILSLTNRIQRASQQVKDLRAAGVGQTPETLLHRLEEETKVNQYFVSDKLPKELNALRDTVAKLSEVVAEPIMGKSQLDDINNQIRAMNAEINKLTEKRMMAGDPTGDKISLFRQQASIIQRKKEAAAEALNDVRHELQAAENELNKKRNELQSALTNANGGEETVDGSSVSFLKADEFKLYVAKLRTKSTAYKQKRQTLSELKAEQGILTRTQEILQKREQLQKDRLLTIETKKGVAGYHDTQENLERVSEMMSSLNERKGQTLEDMSKLVNKLNTAIASKKDRLAPLIQELRVLRPKAAETTQNYEEKKLAYETTLAGVESNRSKLEQEVRAYREECRVEESRYHYLNAMIAMLKQQHQRIQEEMRSYISQEGGEKKKSYRDLYHKKINEQDNLGRTLREKQRGLRESHGQNMRQVKMWQDLEKLLQCKAQCHDDEMALQKAGGVYAGVTKMEKDRLVL